MCIISYHNTKHSCLPSLLWCQSEKKKVSFRNSKKKILLIVLSSSFVVWRQGDGMGRGATESVHNKLVLCLWLQNDKLWNHWLFKLEFCPSVAFCGTTSVSLTANCVVCCFLPLYCVTSLQHYSCIGTVTDCSKSTGVVYFAPLLPCILQNCWCWCSHKLC